MAEAVVSVTLETLRDLLLEEARFLSGVSNQVREIQGQLEMMKSFLEDADQRQHKEKTVLTWVQQVRRLAYKTEDVLETYAVEVVSKRGKGTKNVLKRFACILCEGKALHKVGKEIADIKLGITNLSTSRQTFGIKDLNEGESSKEAKERQQFLLQTYAHEVDEHFVGMENDIQKLVSLVTDNERDHRVISIWGMGGLGKTTLAREIFNHKVVQRSFNAFAWVCITQQCQITEVLQDMLSQILVEDMKVGAQPRALVRKLHEEVEKKNCLVVLDDIWKIEDWEILRPVFSIENVSSKVLLTTRNEELAKIGLSHKPNPLTEEEGWNLLQKKALIKPEEKDVEKKSIFEHVGKDIVRKCGNLPLAISVLGGILREKSSPKEWEMVSTNIDSYLERGKGNQGASNSVHNVLGLSYDELPYYLKSCFLYMGSFREDETIEAEKLYQLWIAEGFVLSEHRKEQERMIDVAERYLKELASRCMVDIQMDDMSILQRVKSCQLHDLMRDLCLAKGNEENFFKIIDLHNLTLPVMDPSCVSDYGRRLGFDFYLNRSTPSDSLSREGMYAKPFDEVKRQYLRTLYVRRVDYSLVDLLLDISALKKFKLLRVLDLENCKFELPSEISQLIHLRYLSLKDSLVKKLPSSIGNLPYLQTLDLRTLHGTYVPNIFWRMMRLKHIYLPDEFHASEKLQFNNLSGLETLHGFQSSGDGLINLSGLVNLRSFSGRLDRHALSQIVDQIHSWRKIKWIELEMFGSDLTSEQGSTLLKKVLLCENLNDLQIVSPIGELPPYNPQFCPNLTRLTLINTAIEENSMQFLKKLPNLRELFLGRNAFVGKEMVCDAMAFPQLRSLTLRDLENLEKWRVDEGAMPNLSHLVITNCVKLETITDGLNFSELKRFDIRRMPEEFKQKYRMLYDQERKKLDG